MILIMNFFAIMMIKWMWHKNIKLRLRRCFLLKKILKIVRVCKNSILKTKTLHIQLSMLDYEISWSLMFCNDNGDQEKFDNPLMLMFQVRNLWVSACASHTLHFLRHNWLANAKDEQKCLSPKQGNKMIV
jgi:hypothetical protein